jgi:hypothetical protein
MRSQNLNEAHKKKFFTLSYHSLLSELLQKRFFIFAPSLDFGYASKPSCLGSAACSDFQGTTVYSASIIFVGIM